MDDKLIIETFVKAIKNGRMTLESVPVAYKEKVKEAMGV